jgi:hypothetical protein
MNENSLQDRNYFPIKHNFTLTVEKIFIYFFLKTSGNFSGRYNIKLINIIVRKISRK